MKSISIYALLDVDELGNTERTVLARLKSLITATKVSRRIYYTQMSPTSRKMPRSSALSTSSSHFDLTRCSLPSWLHFSWSTHGPSGGGRVKASVPSRSSQDGNTR